MVDNLSWTADRILNTCETPLKDKIRERLVGVSPLKVGGPLVLKLMLDIVLDVDDYALCSLTQSLQSLQLKDVPGENISIVVSYLK